MMDIQVIEVTLTSMAAAYIGITTITNAIYRHHPRGAAAEQEQDDEEEPEVKEESTV